MRDEGLHFRIRTRIRIRGDDVPVDERSSPSVAIWVMFNMKIEWLLVDVVWWVSG